LREGPGEGVFQRYIINIEDDNYKKDPLLNPLPQGKGNKKRIPYIGIK